MLLMTDELQAVRENERAFSRFFFLPRIMRKVANCDTSTSILGYKSQLPLYVSFAGLAKLGHPKGTSFVSFASLRRNDLCIR